MFRHFPLLGLHDKASLAGQSAEAAGAQGFFWEMHDLIFERFAEWTTLDPAAFERWLVEAADEIPGLDTAALAADLQAATFAPLMQTSYDFNRAAGLSGTPTVFFNGALFRPGLSPINLEAYVRLTLLEQRKFEFVPPPALQDGRDYYATLHLNLGDLVVRLYPDSAPQAVNSFVYLAQEGWLDGSSLHTVIPGSLVISGDPSSTGFGDAGYFFTDEIDPTLSFDRAGMLAMSIESPHTNSSQFLITLSPQPSLNGTRTIFGEVIAGLELLSGLKARQALNDLLAAPEAVILSIEIEVR